LNILVRPDAVRRRIP